MVEPFRVGIVGAGSVSDGYHAPVLAQFPGVRLEWVCDKDAGKAKSFAARHGIPVSGVDLETLHQVDAVLVAIPVGLRAKTLETAFRRRWHAFIEKPFAVSLQEHDAILTAGRTAGVQVGVGLMRRFYRPTLIALDLLRRNAFGPIKEVWAAEGGPMRGSGRGDDWYQNDPSAAGGGVLIETGSHLIDQALFITDATSFENIRTKFVSYEGLDLDARVSAQARRQGQTEPFHLGVSLSRIEDVCAGLYFVCEKGNMKVSLGADGAVEFVDGEFRALARLDANIRAAGAVYQAFYLEWESFIAQCRGGGPTDAGASSSRLGTALIEAAYGLRLSEAAR
ncbi:MAG: Gfo/Idh/MocA family oxidoreductase [Elusimicrobia bacterium]|nr:Gfo/Idh/MocA family oxidoreductase [Elusimicrobiota bacterium]